MFDYHKLNENERRTIRNTLKCHGVKWENKKVGRNMCSMITSEHLLKVIEMNKDNNHYTTQQTVKYFKRLLNEK